MTWAQLRTILTNDFNLSIVKGVHGSTWVIEVNSYNESDDMVIALDDDDLVLPWVTTMICDSFRIAPAALIACLRKK